jgi:hypothetical protein
MVFIEYPKQDIVFLIGFGRAMHNPPNFKRYVMEPNLFWDIL